MPRSLPTPSGSKDRQSHHIGGYDNKSALVVDMVDDINLGPQISIIWSQWKQRILPLSCRPGSWWSPHCPYASGHHNHGQLLRHSTLVIQLFWWRPCNNNARRRTGAHRCKSSQMPPLTGKFFVFAQNMIHALLLSMPFWMRSIGTAWSSVFGRIGVIRWHNTNWLVWNVGILCFLGLLTSDFGDSFSWLKFSTF